MTIQKCAGLSPTGTQQCAYREACKRYTMPETQNQQWAAFYATAGDDCEYFIPMSDASRCELTVDMFEVSNA